MSEADPSWSSTPLVADLAPFPLGPQRSAGSESGDPTRSSLSFRHKGRRIAAWVASKSWAFLHWRLWNRLDDLDERAGIHREHMTDSERRYAWAGAGMALIAAVWSLIARDWAIAAIMFPAAGMFLIGRVRLSKRRQDRRNDHLR